MARKSVFFASVAALLGTVLGASVAPAAITYDDWFASIGSGTIQYPNHTTSPYQVTLNWGAGTYGHAGGGGEFLVKTAGGDLITYLANNITRNFTTFCLEQGEHISLASLYDISVDQVAYYGTNIKQAVALGSGDPLDASTAVLYGAYFDGSLSSRVGGFSYNANISANALQRAIWSIEDSLALGITVTDLLAKDLINYANALVSSVDRQYQYYVDHVRVMNLWSPSAADSPVAVSKAAQSQLMWFNTPTPALLPHTPEPASLAIWALGLAATAAYHRRRRSCHAKGLGPGK